MDANLCPANSTGKSLFRMMSPQPIDGFRFGDLVVDPTGRRVLNAGKRLPVGPLEFKLLLTLLRNRDRVFTSEELRIQVWSDDPDSAVAHAQDPNALYVAIRRLRSALGDHGKFIVNIPKVGYTVSEHALIDEPQAPSDEMPRSQTPFVGRVAEIATISHALNDSNLVTLVGPPGIGKTRLAIECSRKLQRPFEHGQHLIDLASIDDPQFVINAVATHLKIVENAEHDLEQVLTDFVSTRSILLVFDNCEHLIEESARVISLLSKCAGVCIIATSREPLLLAEETIVTVGPLATPATNGHSTVEDVLGFDSSRLFVELAKRRLPEFELTSREAPFVAELCCKLEGVPVAIELAAAQIDAYPIEQIVAAMSDRFRLLQRRGGRASRHDTLEAAIGWSYNLLSEEEAMLFRRLAVLTGGWTADIAASVCADDKLAHSEIVHSLAGLVRRSLVHIHSRRGSARYNMLDMVRQYAKRRLAEAGEEASIMERRTSVLLDLAERSFDEGNSGDWPRILEEEYDNMRAVLVHTIERDADVVSGLRMTGALMRFWFQHGHIAEAQKWTNAALEKDDGSNPAARARALMAAGFCFGQTPGLDKDADLRRSHFDESVRIWGELEDKQNLGVTLIGYAFFLNRLGDYDAAIEKAERSVELLEQTGNLLLKARAANNLALTLLEIGEFRRAQPILEQALHEARLSNDEFLQGACLHNMAEVALHLGNNENGDEFAAESIRLFEHLNHRPFVARTRVIQGQIQAARGNLDAAAALQKQALLESVEIGDNQVMAEALATLAATLSLSGKQCETALLLESAAKGLCEKLKISFGPAREDLLAKQMRKARSAVGRSTAESAAAKARGLSVVQILGIINDVTG